MKPDGDGDPVPRRSFIERHPWGTLAGCLLVAAALSLLLGQDAFWDLKNYHLYNAWALLHHRAPIDLAAAGLQTFFNPLPDLPYYLLAMDWLPGWPRLVAVLEGLPYGGVVFVVWWMVARMARSAGRAMDAGDAAALLLGVTGAALVPQVGGTTHGVPLALLVLSALALLLRATTGEQPPRLRGLLLAGVLAGLAAGLKPTVVIYLPALGLAWLVAAPAGRRWSGAMALTLGAAGAFLLTYGPWGWHLYALTGNPTFPLFNGVFHSAWTSTAPFTDKRFLPRSTGQWLFYPFYWMFRHGYLVTEARMSDPRFALAFLGLLAIAGTALRRHLTRTAAPGTAASARGWRLLCTFAPVAYVTWLAMFSIFRYAIPIEALTGLFIVAAIRRVTGAERDPAGRRRRFHWTLWPVVVIALAATHYPRWSRTPFERHVFEVPTIQVPADSLVVFVGQPEAYLAPFIHGTGVRFVGFTWLTTASRSHVLWAHTVAQLRAHRGPVFAVLRDRSAKLMHTLTRATGLHVGDGACRPVVSNLEHDRRGHDLSDGLRICRLERRSHATAARGNTDRVQ